jgi:hypothetical protein
VLQNLFPAPTKKLFREACCRRDENLIRKIQSIRELVEIGKAGGLVREPVRTIKFYNVPRPTAAQYATQEPSHVLLGSYERVTSHA